MKRNILISMFVGLWLFFLLEVAIADIINVPADYPSIQDAINAAQPGDTINVSSGTYFEHVIVNKTISLIGEDKSTTIIDVNGTGSVVKVTADSVNIKGFTLQRSGRRPLYVDPDGGIVVYSKYSCIEDNIVKYNNFGILLYRAQYTSVINNEVLNNNEGIYLCKTTDNIITNNKSLGNDRTGIHNERASYNSFNNNRVAGNGMGINNSSASGYNTFIGNVSTNHWHIGFWMNGDSGNILRNNSFSENTYNFGVYGNFDQDVDTSNLVNGRPIYFLKDEENLTINPDTYPDVGYLALIN